jgi:hypothetical protein
MVWPVIEATRVVCRMLPVILQTMERKTRPPSSGKPGMRLKMPSKRMPSRGELLPRNGNWSRRQTAPMRRLVSGPTTASWNSMPGLVGSCWIFETPPKQRHRRSAYVHVRMGR